MSDVPVIPGDNRVACQHCSARVEFTGPPELAWMNPDVKDSALIFLCAPDIWHAPMPKIAVVGGK